MFQGVSWFRERQKWTLLGAVVTTVVTKYAEQKRLDSLRTRCDQFFRQLRTAHSESQASQRGLLKFLLDLLLHLAKFQGMRNIMK